LKVLSIKNLTFSYDEAPVLEDVDLNVEEGSFISILGPNGSGKSTLINIISKVLEGHSGSVEVSGININTLHSKDIAKLVAVVPQYSNPGFNFNVEEMVIMGRFPYISRFGSEKKEDFEIVEDVMSRTKILELANKKFNELSGGEKQRVVIAQALVQDTPVILLDEPTSHLDINFQIEIMDMFNELNIKEGKTIIGVFHDINLAANYSRQALFLKHGRVFFFGDVADSITKDNIRDVFHSDVYVGKNPFTGKLYISPTFTPGYEKEHGKKDVRVHVIGGGGSASPILNLLYNSGYDVSCGVVNNFDTDLETARMLDIQYVAEAPFSPISLYSQNRNMEFIRSSDIVILPSMVFGHGNFSNIVAVKEAADMGKKVIVVEGEKIGQQDYTEGRAAKIYSEIIAKGAIVVEDISGIMKVLKQK
jgi:iron complex transport system ATP-binding protein